MTGVQTCALPISAPNDSQIVPAGNNFNIYTNGVNGAVQFFTDVTGNNHNWAFDGYGYTQLPFSQGFTNTAVITTVGAGNIMLQAGAGPTQNFLFDTDGKIGLPNSAPGTSNTIVNGTGNVAFLSDEQWTIAEYNGAEFGTQGLRINPGINGSTGAGFPGSAEIGRAHV